MGRFADKVAIVTGGASGIGEATVRRLHSEGAVVVVCDIRGDAVDRLTADLGPHRAHGHVTDMMDLGAVEKMITDLAVRFGKLDILG